MCGLSVIPRPDAPVRFNHLLLGFLSLVILLDSKAQQTELEWISYPPNGVSQQNRIECMRMCSIYLDFFPLLSVMSHICDRNNNMYVL